MRQRCVPIACLLLLLIARIGVIHAADTLPDKSRLIEERVVFLAPSSPVFITLQIDCGQQSIAAVRSQFADTQFKRIDANGDGQIDAVEVEAARTKLSNDRFLQPILAELKAEKPIPQADFAKRVEVGLGRRFQVVAKPKRLDQSVDLLPMLDADDDGRLTMDELRHGQSKLRPTDFDDDEALSVAELQPFPRSILDAKRQQAAIESPEIPVISVSTPEDRAEAVKRLLSRYGDAKAKSIPVKALIGGASHPAKEFDLDGNGELSEAEFQSWIDAAPEDLSLTVQMRLGRTVAAKPPKSKLVQGAQNSVVSRPAFLLGGMTVDFETKNNRTDQRDTVSFFKLDFLQADADKNRYLDEMEFAQFSGARANGLQFALVDADDNKQVTVDEIVRFVALDAQIAQAKIVVSVADEAKSLFQLIDRDMDRRISPREFTRIDDTVGPFDRSGRGIAPGDLVSRYRLRFSFGTPDRMQRQLSEDMMTNNMPLTQRGETSGPTWFRRMDRNLDGDLAWREFLGPREAFDRLDSNRDGLISLDEAVSSSNSAGE
jgi:Ca2+-binding EF-hand superfamily protein